METDLSVALRDGYLAELGTFLSTMPKQSDYVRSRGHSGH